MLRPPRGRVFPHSKALFRDKFLPLRNTASGENPCIGVVRLIPADTLTSDRATVDDAVAYPTAAAGRDVIATDDVAVGKDPVARGEAAAGETPGVGVVRHVLPATLMGDAAANLVQFQFQFQFQLSNSNSIPSTGPP